MKYADWNIEAETGYKPKTTFYMDFSIADAFGVDAILDTYKRSFECWKSDVVYLTELVMVLNWKSWEHHYKGNDVYVRTYVDLYEECRNYALDHLKDEGLKYFLDTTD